MTEIQEKTGRLPQVKSAVRVLEVLEFFARTPEPVSLARICTVLKMPKSSGHALMETLRQQGYVYWLGRYQGYYPTRRWRDLGDAITRHDPLLSMVRDILHLLSEKTGETAILAKREENEVLYLDVVEPDKTLRFSAYAGQIKPMHSGASGRALLSLVDSDERVQVLNKLKLQAFSSRTITDVGPLLQVIAEGESRGYHVVIGEYLAETTAIATGFKFGTECYALLVGGPTKRMEGRTEEIGGILTEQVAAVKALV